MLNRVFFCSMDLLQQIVFIVRKHTVHFSVCSIAWNAAARIPTFVLCVHMCVCVYVYVCVHTHNCQWPLIVSLMYAGVYLEQC